MESTLTARQRHDLDSLRWHWSPPFRIACTGEIWTASPLEHPSVVLTADTAEELRQMVRKFYDDHPEMRRIGRDDEGAGSGG